MTCLHSILRVALVCIPLMAGSPSLAFDVGCARTPQLAVRMTRAAITGQMPVQADGYRVQSTRYDAVLDRHWAVIAICGHPERPTFAVPIDSAVEVHSRDSSRTADALQDRTAMVVHAGDVVQAWQQQPNLRIEVAVRAEESGSLGSRVRVRVLHSGFDSGQPLSVIAVVRGSGNVEIVP